MATSSAQSKTTAAAPWRAQFLSDIKQMDQPAFTFTSLHSTSTSNDALPRGRTCIYRGLWGQLPPNEKNKAPRNPEGVYESDLPVLTTDARMAKVPEIFSSSPSETTAAAASKGSGGGGPVEAMWWAVPTQTQWRIRGHAWVLAPGDVGGESAGAKAVREALKARMRKTAGGEESGEWDWEREIVGHFGNLSPGMRGSFKNPSPGTPRANDPGEGEGLGQKVGDELLEDEVARKNFRVVVIVPEEVDLVDLSDPADQRRWLYTYVGAGAKATKAGGVIEGEWEKVELWP
ncbi:hypothetical protein N0V82_001584 [Gnomoniopsis sp. IMI 355080]|nr:hypothetical protein N0V82_001584 [Gnomoniopsis sp. IMI 355080]